MLPFETDVAGLYAAIRSHDPARTVETFRSLPAANQYRRLYGLAARYLQPSADILDWGCGRGHFSYFLLRRGFNVTSFSFEEPPEIFRTISAEESARLTFVRGSETDPVSLPFAPCSFDAIFSVGVLEHVRETGGTEVASLKALRAVLRPDGVFICYHFPNRYSYIEALSRLVYGHRYSRVPTTVKFHKYLFCARDIHSLCGAAGLSVRQVIRYGAIPRNPFNWLPQILRSSRVIATAANVADVVLEPLMAPIVQNYAFVAKRQAANEA